VPPSQPILHTLGPAIEDKVDTVIGRCSSHGFRPKEINVTWTLQGDISELDNNPTITENENETFSLVSYYSRTFDRKHNGRMLTCNVTHMTFAHHNTTFGIITVLCRFLKSYSCLHVLRYKAMLLDCVKLFRARNKHKHEFMDFQIDTKLLI